MKRTLLYFLKVCVVMTLIVSGASFAEPRQTKTLLDQSVELQITNGTFLYVLSTLSVDERVPIGFEPMLNRKAEYNVNIHVSNAKLKDVLDMLVQQQPNYRWEEKDGVINFLPVHSRDPLVERFLSTPVEHFRPKGARIVDIRDEIINLPEVQGLLKTQKLTASRYGYFQRYPSLYTNKEVDLSISDTDVRGILNKVVRESEHKMWIVSRSGMHLELLDIGL